MDPNAGYLLHPYDTTDEHQKQTSEDKTGSGTCLHGTAPGDSSRQTTPTLCYGCRVTLKSTNSHR